MSPRLSREQPKAPPTTKTTPASVNVTVTHGDRVIDKRSGVTKLELVTYYDSIAPWMLPHLKDRPISLVRAPQGIAGQLFFQKHSEAKMRLTETAATVSVASPPFCCSTAGWA